MNAMTRRLCTVSVSAIGLFASGALAQSAKPAAKPETKPVQPAAQPGHEGHNHGNQPHPGVPSNLKPVPANTGNAPSGTDGPSARSIMVFRETSLNTGEILDIEPVTLEYEFKNTGSEALEISMIKPSCGCTVPDMEKKIYEPGEKGTIKVAFDPSGKNGKVSRNITIYTNSSTKPVHTIYVNSIVKQVVVVEPRVLSFNMTQKGSSATKDFKIYGRFEDFKVSRATTQDSETFGIEIIDGGKVEKNGEEMWLQIVRVTILESAKPDSHRTEITVRTNEEHKRLFSLSAVGRVIGDLELTPVRMTMGRLVVGDEFEKQITLRSKAGKAFEITSLNSINVVLDATYTAEPVDAEKRDEWVISVKGTVIHPAQRFNAQLNVVTDVPDEEMMTIQMYGQLQPKGTP